MPIKPENRHRYPDDWDAISARIRSERACNRCECDGRCGKHSGRCEARNHQPHPQTRSFVVLTVAHLDHVPENCDPDNLMAMCQRCHLAYDAPRKREDRRAERVVRGLFDDGGTAS